MGRTFIHFRLCFFLCGEFSGNCHLALFLFCFAFELRCVRFLEVLNYVSHIRLFHVHFFFNLSFFNFNFSFSFFCGIFCFLCVLACFLKHSVITCNNIKQRAHYSRYSLSFLRCHCLTFFQLIQSSV